MDLVFARSRRRAALRRAEPKKRSALDWQARLTDRLGAKRVQVNELRRPYRTPE